MNILIYKICDDLHLHIHTILCIIILKFSYSNHTFFLYVCKTYDSEMHICIYMCILLDVVNK